MKKVGKFKHFSSRVRTVVIIVTAVTLLIYNIICYASARKILKEDFFSRSDIVVKKTNERFEEYMDEFSMNIDLVAENNILCDSLENGNYDGNALLVIQNLAAMDRYIQNVEIYSNDLTIFYRTNDNPTDGALQKLFSNFIAEDRMYKTLFLKNGEDKYKLTVCRGIYRDNTCLGYMLVYVDHNQIIETFRSAEKFVNGENIYILDSANKMVSVKMGKLISAKYDDKTTKAKMKAISGFEPYEIYESEIEKLDMKVLTFVAPTYVLKQLGKLAYHNIFISIIILVLCVLGSISLGKSISEPIKEIKNYIEENISE